MGAIFVVYGVCAIVAAALLVVVVPIWSSIDKITVRENKANNWDRAAKDYAKLAEVEDDLEIKRHFEKKAQMFRMKEQELRDTEDA